MELDTPSGACLSPGREEPELGVRHVAFLDILGPAGEHRTQQDSPSRTVPARPPALGPGMSVFVGH